jgi:hypothetical protein
MADVGNQGHRIGISESWLRIGAVVRISQLELDGRAWVGFKSAFFVS